MLLVLVMVFSIMTRAEALRTSLVPKNAQFVIHVDVQKFVATRLKDILLDSKLNHFKQAIRQAEKIAKIDFFKDIKGVTFLGLGPLDDEPIVAISGNFDKDHLISLLHLEDSTTETAYDKFTLYHWDGNEYGVFAADDLLVVGNNKYKIQNVLDAYSGKSAQFSGTPMAAKLSQKPADAFLVAAAENVSQIIGDKEASAVLKKANMLLLVAQESSGLLHLSLTLDTDSLESAENIKKITDGLLAMAAMHEEVSSKIEALKSINISRSGNAILLEISGDPQEMFGLLLGIGGTGGPLDF